MILRMALFFMILFQTKWCYVLRHDTVEGIRGPHGTTLYNVSVNYRSFQVHMKVRVLPYYHE
jgi:hypothetical protein